MITPEEMRRRIDSTREELIRTRARDMLLVGLDMVALVKARVINKGLNAEGETFGVYSAAYQKRRIKKNLDDKPFPVKNFKFATRMWNNTTATIVKESRDQVTVRLAPTTAMEIQKLQWNEERDGPIIAINKKENALLTRTIEKRYRRVLINNNII